MSAADLLLKLALGATEAQSTLFDLCAEADGILYDDMFDPAVRAVVVDSDIASG